MPEADVSPADADRADRPTLLPYEIIEHILGFLVHEPAPEHRHPNRDTYARSRAPLPPAGSSATERPTLHSCLLVSRAFRRAASRILRGRALHFGCGVGARVWAEEFRKDRDGVVARHLDGQVPACWLDELYIAGGGAGGEADGRWTRGAEETRDLADVSHFRTLNALTIARAFDEVIGRHRPSANAALTAWSTTAVHYLLTHCGPHLDTVVLGHLHTAEPVDRAAPFDRGLRLCEVNGELMRKAVRILRKFAPSLHRLRLLVPYTAFLPELGGPFERLEELVISDDLLSGRALDGALSLLISTLPPDPTQRRLVGNPFLSSFCARRTSEFVDPSDSGAPCAIMGTRLRKLSVMATSMGKHHEFLLALTAYRSAGSSRLPVTAGVFGHTSTKEEVVCVAEGLRHLRVPPLDMTEHLSELFGRMTRLEYLCLDPFIRMPPRLQVPKTGQPAPLARLLRALPRSTVRDLSFRCPDWDTVGLVGELLPQLRSLSMHLPEYRSAESAVNWARLGAGCPRLDLLRLCFISSGVSSQRDAVRDAIKALPALRHLFLFAVDNPVDTMGSLTAQLAGAEYPRLQTLEVINPDYPWDRRAATGGDLSKREVELIEQMRRVTPNARINLHSSAPWEADFPS